MNAFTQHLASIDGSSPGHRIYLLNVRRPEGLWQGVRREVERLRYAPGREAADSAGALRRFAGAWRQRVEADPVLPAAEWRETLTMLDAIAEAFAEAVQPTKGWMSHATAGLPPEDLGASAAEQSPGAFDFHHLLTAPEGKPEAWAPFVVVSKDARGETAHAGAEVLSLEFFLVPSRTGEARLHPLTAFSGLDGNIGTDFKETITLAWRLASRPDGFTPRAPLGLWWRVSSLWEEMPRRDRDAPRLTGSSAGGGAYRALVGLLRNREPALPLKAVADANGVCIMARLAESDTAQDRFAPGVVHDVAIKGCALVDAIRKCRRLPPGAGDAARRLARVDTIAVVQLSPEDREVINEHIRRHDLERALRVLDLAAGS